MYVKVALVVLVFNFDYKDTHMPGIKLPGLQVDGIVGT